MIEVKRKARGKEVYYEQSISTDGETFILVKYEDKDGGFEWEINTSMSKEFFKKLKHFYIQSTLKNKVSKRRKISVKRY